jgi:hypothetical protein
MKKIYYEKVGRKYIAVSEYDSDYQDSYPKGNTLVMVSPGSTSRRYNVDPNFAAMIAAGRHAESAMSIAMQVASELRPTQTPITTGQQKAWKKLAKEFGSDLCTLNGLSTHDIVDAGMKVMQEEAHKLMQNVAVKAAYDQFMLVCALTKDHTNEHSI